jgi:hypothetical protein
VVSHYLSLCKALCSWVQPLAVTPPPTCSMCISWPGRVTLSSAARMALGRAGWLWCANRWRLRRKYQWLERTVWEEDGCLRREHFLGVDTTEVPLWSRSSIPLLSSSINCFRSRIRTEIEWEASWVLIFLAPLCRPIIWKHGKPGRDARIRTDTLEGDLRSWDWVFEIRMRRHSTEAGLVIQIHLFLSHGDCSLVNHNILHNT